MALGPFAMLCGGAEVRSRSEPLARSGTPIHCLAAPILLEREGLRSEPSHGTLAAHAAALNALAALMGATGAKRFMVWRQAAPQAAMTPLLYANIAKALEALNVAGQSHPRWQAKVNVLQHASATATGAKDAYLVSLSGDAQDAGYIVLRAERQVIEAGSSMFEILDRTGLYRPRFVLGFDGFIFSVGDFVLRLGRATTAGRVYGPLLEVEYRPVSSPQLAAQPMAEMFASIHRAVSGLDGGFVVVDEPRLADYGLSAQEHTGRHSALSLVYAVAAMMMTRRDASAAGGQ